MWKSLTLAKFIHSYLHYDFIVIFCWFISFVDKSKHCYFCSSLFLYFCDKRIWLISVINYCSLLPFDFNTINNSKVHTSDVSLGLTTFHNITHVSMKIKRHWFESHFECYKEFLLKKLLMEPILLRWLKRANFDREEIYQICVVVELSKLNSGEELNFTKFANFYSLMSLRTGKVA